MFKITNEQLIQIAAVDAGLDPFAEYCTKGVYKANGYTVRAGSQPVLTLELWCPRISKGEQAESLSTSEVDSSEGHTFFMFKLCHLFTRSQVASVEELQAEKEARRFAKAQERKFKQTVKSMGGIAPSKDYESLPQWCKNKAGMALDVMVGELSQVGYQVQDANGLFEMLIAN